MEAVARRAEVGGTPENREESGGKVSKRYENLWKKMVDFALKKMHVMVHYRCYSERRYPTNNKRYGGEMDLWIVKSEFCSRTGMRSFAGD